MQQQVIGIMLKAEIELWRGLKISRCIRSSRPDPDYAIFLSQFDSFEEGW
jgi:hypothetical protein